MAWEGFISDDILSSGTCDTSSWNVSLNLDDYKVLKP